MVLNSIAGILGAEGMEWRERRKFILNQFRKFGLTDKHGLESRVLEEAGFLVDAVLSEKGRPFCPKRVLTNATSNVLSVVTIGKRYDYNDDEFCDILHDIHTHMTTEKNISWILPKFLVRIIMGKALQENVQVLDNLQKRLEPSIEQHQRERVDDHSRDLIDAYLKVMDEKDEQYLKATRFDIETMKADIVDLLIGGGETTSTALVWALLCMVTYPEIQKRAQSEIDTVVGKDGVVRGADRSKLPYIQAILLEVTRIHTIVPIIPHVTTSDTSLNGHHIPKGAIVIANIRSIHCDPNIWNDPDEFKPERFIGDDGQVVVPKQLIPFSTGHRICIGEKIADMEMMIFFANLLQKFSFRLPEGSSSPSFEGILGTSYSPQPFEVCAEARN